MLLEKVREIIVTRVCLVFSSTPLHLAVQCSNTFLTEELLQDIRTDCEWQDKSGHVPLWYALKSTEVYLNLFQLMFLLTKKVIYSIP